MIKVYGILLAAGDSNRMKARFPKLALPFRQRPLLYWSLKAALDSSLESVSLVVGANSNKLLYALRDVGGDDRLIVVINDRWEKGRSTSVATGLGSIPDDADYVMFIQGDQPLMTTELIDALIDLVTERPGAPLYFPVLDGVKVNPVIFSRETISELKAIKGDETGFKLAEKYTETACTMELVDGTTQLDVDSNEDYKKLIEFHEKK